MRWSGEDGVGESGVALRTPRGIWGGICGVSGHFEGSRAALVGVAGGSLLHFWRECVPGGSTLEVDAVEIDGAVLEAARAHLGMYAELEYALQIPYAHTVTPVTLSALSHRSLSMRAS